jgi:hypothetical protein
MIAAALSWLDRGFAVFPLKPRGKVPLGSLVPPRVPRCVARSRRH